MAEPFEVLSPTADRGGGRLPEREPSQLVLDQVLIQACKISTIYTQFQPIMLQF